MTFTKLTTNIVLFLLIFSILLNSSYAQTEPIWWDNNWSYREEINIPIDTNDENSHYQPVDIRLEFNNPCWGIDQNKHSIRVVYWYENKWHEIESQIYDLQYSKENIIQSCSLVFLIPEIMNNDVKFYIYYDDTEKSSTNYLDHVIIKKEHYFYEPLPGQSINLDYYKIIDNGICVYGVGIKGMMMVEYASNLIFTQKSGNKEFNVKNWDQLVGFCFQYDNKNGDVISTRHSVLSNEISIDGNLMVEFGIESTNEEKTAKTTNFYKYYDYFY